MTSLVGRAVDDFVFSGVEAVSNSAGVVALALLVVVLVQREVLRALGTPDRDERGRRMSGVVLPLSLIFAASIVARGVEQIG